MQQCLVHFLNQDDGACEMAHWYAHRAAGPGGPGAAEDTPLGETGLVDKQDQGLFLLGQL